MVEFIPGFRVHVALSKERNEAIIAAQMKSANSPYPEIDAGYSWHDFEPVSVSPLNSKHNFLGQRVKAVLLLSKNHYKAPATQKLKEEREARKQYLAETFGTPDSRLLLGKFVDRSYAFIASRAKDLQSFWLEYEHFIVEDGNENQIRIGKVYEIGQSEKTCEINPFVTISLDCNDEILWKSLISSV
jgi:hypothetical protein